MNKKPGKLNEEHLNKIDELNETTGSKGSHKDKNQKVNRINNEEIALKIEDLANASAETSSVDFYLGIESSFSTNDTLEESFRNKSFEKLLLQNLSSSSNDSTFTLVTPLNLTISSSLDKIDFKEDKNKEETSAQTLTNSENFVNNKHFDSFVKVKEIASNVLIESLHHGLDSDDLSPRSELFLAGSDTNRAEKTLLDISFYDDSSHIHENSTKLYGAIKSANKNNKVTTKPVVSS